MASDPDFEAYLSSKRIDSPAFRSAEPDVWDAWKKEFEQMHPNSFTVQKLNLINPIRRKYQLPQAEAKTSLETNSQDATPTQPSASIPPGRPVIRPRPKMDRD